MRREILKEFRDLIEGDELVLSVTRISEGVQKTEPAIHWDFQKNEGVGFFSRDLEVTIVLHFALGFLPPFFEATHSVNLGSEQRSKLICRSTPPEIHQNLSGQTGGTSFSKHLHPSGVSFLESDNVRGGNRRQCFCSVSDLHGMLLPSFEIDQDLVAAQVPLRDTSESPAFVSAEGFRREAVELISGFLIECAALNGLC